MEVSGFLVLEHSAQPPDVHFVVVSAPVREVHPDPCDPV